MTESSISEITFIFEAISISIVTLTVLLILIKAALFILRRLARLQVARTDLDLIGVVAVVTHTIRPRRPGKIRCQTEHGELVTEATSDNTIRSGQTVLITAINQGAFRVLPYDPDAHPASTDIHPANTDNHATSPDAPSAPGGSES